jgi:L-histidine N-alpha-methyltransferase
LYDERGGELFGRITQLPEYYLTRAEASILERVTAELARAAPARTIVELGAGDSPKTLQLVDACVASGVLEEFASFDIDPGSMGRGLDAVRARWPQLRTRGMVADMMRDLDLLPDSDAVLVALLGSTIGNFLPEQRVDFYRTVADRLAVGSWLLVGYDLVKEPEVVRAAYDDASGVTASFTGNVLRMLNRELDADFDETAFQHEARWMADSELVRVGLRSTRDQQVRIGAIDLDVAFAADELLHLEVCCKFRRGPVTAELEGCGLRVDRWWTDPQDRFALGLARREGD